MREMALPPPTSFPSFGRRMWEVLNSWLVSPKNPMSRGEKGSRKDSLYSPPHAKKAWNVVMLERSRNKGTGSIWTTHCLILPPTLQVVAAVLRPNRSACGKRLCLSQSFSAAQAPASSRGPKDPEILPKFRGVLNNFA